jgi:hypothetical protein
MAPLAGLPSERLLTESFRMDLNSQRRSADLQSAVSPICNRQGVEVWLGSGLGTAPAATRQQVTNLRYSAGYKPAIQQIENLRYATSGLDLKGIIRADHSH